MSAILTKYFPDLTPTQLSQFEQLDRLYHEWNAKINIISRKDIDNLYEHHVLHSLAIARAIDIHTGSRLLDLGTGGGFPGIPLAIMLPKCQFKLIDGTGKKIRVCQEVAASIGLNNVLAEHKRGEDEHGRFDYVVSRAVMPLPDLVRLVRKNATRGIACLKGGDIETELRPYPKARVMDISSWFNEPWFADKKVIYLPL